MSATPPPYRPDHELIGHMERSQGDDYDDAYLAAARRASQLRGGGALGDRIAALRAQPVRASAPGRDFALEPVGPGWVLYSSATIEGALEPAGVCVEVVNDSLTDTETGEIVPRTTYRCLRYWTPGNAHIYVPAGEVDRNHLVGVDRIEASEAVRWLVKPLVQRPAATRRRHVLTGREVERVHDAWRLAAAVVL